MNICYLTKDRANYEVQRTQSIQDYVFTDGYAEESVEKKFAKVLDESAEVCVYAVLNDVQPLTGLWERSWPRIPVSRRMEK